MSAPAVGAIVNSAAYCEGRRVADVEIKDIGRVLSDPGRFIWIGLHDLAIEDAHRAHQRPKMERYGDALFIALRTAQRDRETRRIVFGETHIFVGSQYLVSVRHGPSLSYAEVRARCETTPKLLCKGPGFVLYALMDFVVDQYFPIVRSLQDDLDALEDEIFGESFGRETTERIYQLKRDLLDVKRATAPLVDVCNRLMRYDLEVIPEDTRPYFRDVYDHVIRINDMVDTLRELLSTALEANCAAIGRAERVDEAAGRVGGNHRGAHHDRPESTA